MASASRVLSSYVERNGKPVAELTARALLKATPLSAYTTMRTVDRTMIFQMGPHMRRLAETVSLMLQDEKEENIKRSKALLPLQSEKTLRPIIIPLIQGAVHRLRHHHPDQMKDELKVMLLVSWRDTHDDVPYDVFIHLSALNRIPPTPPVKVQVRTAFRLNPQAKHSTWVIQAEELEKQLPKDFNDVLLMHPNQTLLEGMTSNFFVIQEGKIRTAGEGVLGGTVRDLVFNVCKEAKMECILKAPRIDERDKWQGVFITSTSRLVLPIHCVTFPDLNLSPLEFNYSDSHIICRLEALVRDEVRRNSEPVIENHSKL